MALLYRTEWNPVDGSPWPTEYVATVSNGAAETRDGLGRLSVTDTSGASARVALTGVAAQQDLDVRLAYIWSSNDPQSYLDFWVGSGGWSGGYRPLNGAGFELRSNAGTAVIQKNIAGSTTTFETQTVTSVSVGLKYVRIQVLDGEFRFKVWDGFSEPESWYGPYDVSDVPGDCQFYVAHNRAGSNSGDKEVGFLFLDVYNPVSGDGADDDDDQLWELLMGMDIIPHVLWASGTVGDCRKVVAITVTSDGSPWVYLTDGQSGDVIASIHLPTGGTKTVMFAGGTVHLDNEAYVDIIDGDADVMVYGV